MPRDFTLLCEIEPATRPDLRQVRRQIVAWDGVTDSFLIPDNHLGRATVSSIAVAHEVQSLGGSAVACVNSRDRNLLGFRRDLLTAAAYGVHSFLFVRGDDPTEGGRSTDLTVRTMIGEARAFPDGGFRVGATARPIGPVPDWKHETDFLLTQFTFDAGELVAWRRRTSYDGDVFAGVLVLASAKMAHRIASTIRDSSVPDALLARLESDRDAGVEHALAMVDEIRASGLFAGVHLIPVSRYLQVAERLRTERRH